MAGCNASKNSTTTPTVVVPVVKPDKTDEVKTDTETVDTVLIALDTIIEVPIKSKFTIAVLLPFNLDNQAYSSFDIQNMKFDRSTKMAIEFYNGFQLALDEIQKNRFEIDIHYLDTKNDDFTIKQLLKKPPFPKVDLIIGPIFNKNLRVASDFAKTQEIPLISPLSSASNITKDNPYYYTANGTSLAHLEKMMQHLHTFYPNDTLHVIHNNSEREIKIIEEIIRINNIDTAGIDTSTRKIILKEIPLTVNDEIETVKIHFDSLQSHLVFIPSTNEIFSTYVLNQLARLKTYYPSTVFGMPNWYKFRNINYDYFEWLKVHLTESNWVNEYNIDVIDFDDRFKRKYIMPPTEYAIQGYDLANFVLSYIENNSNIFEKNKENFFTVSNSEIGLQTKFNFIPRKSEKSNSIDFWDNSFIHIVKFENYRFNKID